MSGAGDMGERRALLIGSLPFADEAEAMDQAMATLGPYLDSLPDGEIGEKTDWYPKGDRSAWVQTIMDRCEANTTAWEVKRAANRNSDGYAANYESGPRLKGKFPPKEMAAHLDFGWAEFARRSYPLFKKRRSEAGRTDLKFQVGLPTAFGMTFGIMSPLDAIRYSSAFTKRLAQEANEILDFTEPDEVRFQLEVPGELALAYRLPLFAVRFALRNVLDLLNQVRPGASFGVHLCLGDLNNEALIHAKSLTKMVGFTNALMEKWPSAHPLDYVHVPLAEAADPPPIDPAWYAPLADMKLPAGVRFVAGFVHPGRTTEELAQIRKIVDDLRGQPVDIASSCGLGRVPQATAEQLLSVTRDLVAPTL
ncbi:MAG: hypothetical protein ACR2PK_17490 [Acidimicrobiales bacterium]